MTEEIDSIAPAAPSASLDLTGARVDVTLAKRPAQANRAPPARPAAATPSPAASGQPLQSDSIEESVKRINARLAPLGRIVQLRVDPGTGITIAEIRNSATGEVLQQIPSNDIVHLAEMLSGWAHGKNVLLDLIA